MKIHILLHTENICYIRMHEVWSTLETEPGVMMIIANATL